MDYIYIINELVAFCQREGSLSTDSETLLKELEDLTGYALEELAEII